MPGNPDVGAEPALARRGSGENWGSKIGVILAVAGSAVGLGNFLRFPGLAATNGGGVFMIPYFISMLILGIPICWVEWTMGRYGGTRGYNGAGIFSVLWRRSYGKYFGVLALLIPVVIYMYYVYIEAWCLSYAIDYATGKMASIAEGADSGEEITKYSKHFCDFVGFNANGFPQSRGLIILATVFIINFALIFRGLTRGIEVFCKYAMPLLVFFAIIILFRVLTLGTPDPEKPDANINNALGFMWNPKPLQEGKSVWAALRNPQLWLEASGQIFFSLSVGFGIVLNYASYLRKDDDVALSGLTASATNQFCEVCLGGLITVPVAFLFLGVSRLTPEVLGSTMALGFHAMPAVFARMPAGQLFGTLWFVMLFTAAITSSLSMLQPAIAFLEEGFDLGRRASVTCLGCIVAIGGLIVVYFSKNLLALETMNFWVGTVCIFIVATIQVITVGWIFGINNARKEAKRGAELQIPNIYWFIIKYISPLYLLTIFAFWCYYNMPAYFATLTDPEILEAEDRQTVLFTLAFLVAILAFFTMLVYLAGRRWKEQEKWNQAMQEVSI